MPKSQSIAATINRAQIVTAVIEAGYEVRLCDDSIETIEVVRHGVTRRKQLYFLRDRVGKAVRLKERRRS